MKNRTIKVEEDKKTVAFIQHIKPLKVTNNQHTVDKVRSRDQYKQTA